MYMYKNSWNLVIKQKLCPCTYKYRDNILTHLMEVIYWSHLHLTVSCILYIKSVNIKFPYNAYSISNKSSSRNVVLYNNKHAHVCLHFWHELRQLHPCFFWMFAALWLVVATASHKVADLKVSRLQIFPCKYKENPKLFAILLQIFRFYDSGFITMTNFECGNKVITENIWGKGFGD